MSSRQQTLNEEVWNALTHGAGVLFCLIAIPVLVIYALKNSTPAIAWSVSIFSFGMLMTYLSSTVYHTVQNEKLKPILRVWDHISIYLFIAGSYTPMMVRYLDAGTATIFLGIMWGIVAVASFLKIFYTGRFKAASVGLYLALGWMAIFVIKPLMATLPLSVFWWLLAGGLCYTLGTVFYMRDRRLYHHSIWHCFVLAGTVTHYVAIFKSTTLPLNIH